MRRRVILLLLVAGLALAAATGRARAQALVADLTSHLVAITTGFTGTELVLFGATDGPGAIIVMVRGPERDAVVRRKSRVAGIWMNTREVTFTGIPGYYAVYSSRPLEEVAPPSMLALNQIGLANLRLGTSDQKRPPEEIALFRSAVIREQQRRGLFSAAVGHVNFLGERLFRTTIAIPADVPTGNYEIHILLVRDKVVVSGQTSNFVVEEEGVAGDVHDFAERRALLYGMIAVLGAAIAGWLASLPFRNA